VVVVVVVEDLGMVVVVVVVEEEEEDKGGADIGREEEIEVERSAMAILTEEAKNGSVVVVAVEKGEEVEMQEEDQAAGLRYNCLCSLKSVKIFASYCIFIYVKKHFMLVSFRVDEPKGLLDRSNTHTHTHRLLLRYLSLTSSHS